MIADTSLIIPKDSILMSLHHIEKYTNDFHDGWTTTFTICSILASIVTIIGLITIFIELSRSWRNYNFRKKIILDLVRHFMINNSILEVIRSKRSADPDYKPIEGALERFATLDSDMELARFSVNSNSYELIHNLSISIRNYNSVVRYADKHFHNGKITDQEIDDIFYRGVDLSMKIMDLGDENKYWSTGIVKLIRRIIFRKNRIIDKKVLKKYIAEFKYGDQWLAKQVRENRYDNKFKILSRAIKEKPYYQFYDNLSLGKTLDDLIRYNSTRF